jgi:protein phosphatase
LDAAYTTLRARPGPDEGATLAALVLEGRRLTLGWVGDALAWRSSAGKLLRLSEPHTLAQELVRCGRIRPEEARGHLHTNILLRCVGAHSPDAAMDVLEIELAPGDRVLIASDGLWRTLGEGEIARALAASRGPRDGVVRLHRAALDAGASDNVTAVILAV